LRIDPRQAKLGSVNKWSPGELPFDEVDEGSARRVLRVEVGNSPDGKRNVKPSSTRVKEKKREDQENLGGEWVQAKQRVPLPDFHIRTTLSESEGLVLLNNQSHAAKRGGDCLYSLIDRQGKQKKTGKIGDSFQGEVGKRIPREAYQSIYKSPNRGRGAPKNWDKLIISKGVETSQSRSLPRAKEEKDFSQKNQRGNTRN